MEFEAIVKAGSLQGHRQVDSCAPRDYEKQVICEGLGNFGDVEHRVRFAGIDYFMFHD